jgi:hypothetical protein
MPAPRAADSLPALSALLGARLRARAAALAQEVRDYPTPIARCDDQLGGLLERRRRVFAALEAVEAADAVNQADAAATLAALEACAAALAPGDLDAAFLAPWRAALEALRAEWAARPGGCGPADAWANDGGALA